MQGRFARSPAALDERCTAFVQLQAWPLLERLDWQGWLSNFSIGDEPFYARCLLEAFIYFSAVHSEALLRAAFHALSRDVCSRESDPGARTTLWRNFLDRVVLTYVEGEQPSPTDSGLAFARRGRIILGIPQDRIVAPARALELLERDRNLPVVFLDDFVGSGKQFEKTWARPYTGAGDSFASLASQASTPIWYVPLLATQYGLNRLGPLAPGAKICPAHTITDRYSALSDVSLIWPVHLVNEGRDFVESSSQRAGYPSSECWGFHRLGLCIGIIDSIPDSSLPLFYSERNGWRPLIARR